MTEALLQAGAAGPATIAPAYEISAGAMLRQAREAAGLHVAAMAVSLKVPVGKLEALEQDRYDLLPDAVFARGLASSVCRTLKIDPRPVLERLPRTAAPRLIQNNDGINAPFRSPRDAMTPGWREQLTRPVSLIVGALLLGAVVIVLLPQTLLDQSVATASANDRTLPKPAARALAASALADAASVALTASAAAPAQPAARSVAAAVALPQTSQSAAAPAAQAAPAAIAATTAAVSAADPGASAAPPAAGAGPVVFRVNAPSWIEVRDANGAVPLRKVLAAGESADVSGVMPLQVIVGNVQGTEVDVHGKRFDLRHLTRDNVARFQIK